MKRVGWVDRDEWLWVRKHIFSASATDRHDAIARIDGWAMRGSLPLAVEATAALMRLDAHTEPAPGLQDITMTTLATADMYTLRLALSMALTRFVNGFCDAEQKGVSARSVSTIATQLGMPEFVVDLRHAATHEALPELPILRLASTAALQWLQEVYWDRQADAFESSARAALDIVEQYYSRCGGKSADVDVDARAGSASTTTPPRHDGKVTPPPTAVVTMATKSSKRRPTRASARAAHLNVPEQPEKKKQRSKKQSGRDHRASSTTTTTATPANGSFTHRQRKPTTLDTTTGKQRERAATEAARKLVAGVPTGLVGQLVVEPLLARCVPSVPSPTLTARGHAVGEGAVAAGVQDKDGEGSHGVGGFASFDDALVVWSPLLSALDESWTHFGSTVVEGIVSRVCALQPVLVQHATAAVKSSRRSAEVSSPRSASSSSSFEPPPPTMVRGEGGGGSGPCEIPTTASSAAFAVKTATETARAVHATQASTRAVHNAQWLTSAATWALNHLTFPNPHVVKGLAGRVARVPCREFEPLLKAFLHRLALFDSGGLEPGAAERIILTYEIGCGFPQPLAQDQTQDRMSMGGAGDVTEDSSAVGLYGPSLSTTDKVPSTGTHHNHVDDNEHAVTSTAMQIAQRVQRLMALSDRTPPSSAPASAAAVESTRRGGRMATATADATTRRASAWTRTHDARWSAVPIGSMPGGTVGRLDMVPTHTTTATPHELWTHPGRTVAMTTARPCDDDKEEEEDHSGAMDDEHGSHVNSGGTTTTRVRQRVRATRSEDSQWAEGDENRNVKRRKDDHLFFSALAEQMVIL
eukprot:m.46765 g.46765  ORF g.46765 m.46765 type:complete len:813 (+) comp6801_c0_seq1:205-2643(+)